ncbi:MAG: hypothetical protein V2J14_03965 [Erythrobacter sp.]|jgi:hypothetical protein|nr:hypothetical protein [Erythrobacter sp.]
MHRTAQLTALALVSSLLFTGCVARAVGAVVTAPVKIASKTVDLATTSQSEADEKRGRELRRREEELGKLQRQYDKELEDCREGDRRACNKAQLTYADIEQLKRTIPAPPPE